jgi:ATP-dependent DNA helicase RecQ
MGHVEALVDAGHELELDHLMPSPDRAAEIRSAFDAAGTLMLSPVRELLGDGFSYEELRLVRLQLKQRDPEPMSPG